MEQIVKSSCCITEFSVLRLLEVVPHQWGTTFSWRLGLWALRILQIPLSRNPKGRRLLRVLQFGPQNPAYGCAKISGDPIQSVCSQDTLAVPLLASVTVWSRFTGRAYVLGYREVTFAAWADGWCLWRTVWLVSRVEVVGLSTRLLLMWRTYKVAKTFVRVRVMLLIGTASYLVWNQFYDDWLTWAEMVSFVVLKLWCLLCSRWLRRVSFQSWQSYVRSRRFRQVCWHLFR